VKTAESPQKPAVHRGHSSRLAKSATRKIKWHKPTGNADQPFSRLAQNQGSSAVRSDIVSDLKTAIFCGSAGSRSDIAQPHNKDRSIAVVRSCTVVENKRLDDVLSVVAEIQEGREHLRRQHGPSRAGSRVAALATAIRSVVVSQDGELTSRKMKHSKVYNNTMPANACS
jgi:hypothetical protein